MKRIWSKISKQKNLIIFLTIIFLFGIGIGIYFGFSGEKIIQTVINNYALNIKEQTAHFAIPHFTILSLLFVLSFIGLGVPAGIAYLFYEGLSIGFCGTVFSIAFHFQGFLYIIVFFTLTKIPFLLIYLFFFHKLASIAKSIISWLIYKESKKERLIHLSLGCFVLIIFLLIYDLFFDFLGINIVKSLNFLLT